MTMNIVNQLNYTTSEINRNFKIKVHSKNHNGEYLNKAVGVKGLCEIIRSAEIVNWFLDRAFSTPVDKCVCKLRRGIKVTFYYY